MKWRTHPAEFTETTVFFTWVTSAPDMDMRSMARRLLEAGIAETVTSPSDGAVRLSPAFRKAARLRSKALALKEAQTATSRLELLRWALRQPRMAASILPGAMRIRPDSADKAEPVDLGQIVLEIDQHVWRVQAESALKNAVDQIQYRVGYLEREPFLRLNIAPFHVNVGSTSPTDRVSVDVNLTLHYSGVMTLTFGMRLPEGSDTNEIGRWTHAGQVPVAWFEIPDSVRQHARKRNRLAQSAGPGPSDEPDSHWWERSAGPDELLSLADIYRVYEAALGSSADVEIGPEWMCYPTVFADEPKCCRSERVWTRRHSTEVDGILAKLDEPGSVRRAESRARVPDTSYNPETSLWHSSAISLRIKWTAPTTGADRFAPVLFVVEAYLIRLWALRVLAMRLENASLGGAKDVRKLQARLVFGLAEFEDRTLNSVSASDDVERMLEGSGARRQYQSLRERCADLAQLYATVRSERAARRALFVAVLALASATVFALPAIDGSLKILSRSGDEGVLGSAAAHVANFHARGDAPLLVLVALVAATCLAAAIARATRWRPRRRYPAAPGDVWPGPSVRVVERPTPAGDAKESAELSES